MMRWSESIQRAWLRLAGPRRGAGEHGRAGGIWAAAAALLALALLCGALGLLVRPPARVSAEEQLRAARARWDARGFTGYRIVSRMGDCVQRGEFRGPEILSISRQDCFDSIRTVEALFLLAERAQSWGLGSPRCAPSGCVCRETRSFYAVYDEQLGYPRAIRLRKYRTVDWAYLLGHPTAYHGLLGCMSPPEMDLVVVLALEPLP